MLVQSDPLSEAVSSIFKATGSANPEASCVARHLVDANLSGHDSHGVIRVSQYLDYMNEGTLIANQNISVVFESDTIGVVDGHMGFGQVIGEQAMNVLSSKAKASGLGLVTIRNCGHIGRGGSWAEQLAKDDLISLHFVSTTGLGMFAVPFGGTDRRMSLAVMVVGVPVEGRPPIMLDCATSTTAEGKIRVARNKGVPVPEGQIVDKQGNPTTDPNDFYEGGAVLMMAGHKGYGLNFMTDLLAGALSGSGCTKPGVNHLINTMTSIAIDPGSFTNRETYMAEIKQFCDWVVGSPPKDPNGKVLLPGQIEHETRAQRQRDGIPIDDETWRRLVEVAVSVGLQRESFDRLVC